ncbi:MAG: hypothetical protein KKA07_09980 [Bacteroidetes bacterium]|nr:hypothetical protein [Bacteroidota bacterium]
MADGKDLELLDRFTDALNKSGNVGATEIGPDAKVHVHVMPDRVIEVIRLKINDLIMERNRRVNLGEKRYIEIENLVKRYEEAIFRLLDVYIK